MNVYAILAALGTLVIAGPAFFVLGRSRGQGAERQRQADAKATAEETAKRIVGEAERDADNLRKDRERKRLSRAADKARKAALSLKAA